LRQKTPKYLFHRKDRGAEMGGNKKPNVLFIFSDQQRWDTCGCYGQPLDVTPNLDKMAKDGVMFEHAYSCQPVCGPARAALQTGRWPTEIGCNVNHRLLPIDENTIAKMLSANGYEVGYIGKWHLASCGDRNGPDDFREKPVPEERRGGYLDYWIASDVLEFTSHSYDGHMFDADGNKRSFPAGRFRADAQTDWVIEYLENRRSDKPFFMFVSYIEPHHQNDHNCYEGPHGSKEKYKDFIVPGDLEGTDGDWRQNYPDYLGCINSLDNNVGRIRETLEKLGLGEDTVVIYTSDHGSHFCTRNPEYKRSCHDGCTRVPMIFTGPGFEGGRNIDNLVSLIDLPSTVLRICGVNPPKTVRGRDLKSLVAGDADDWLDEVFIQISESQCGRAIRTRKWKYSVRAPGDAPELKWAISSDVYQEDFLYDLENDPHERKNLIKDPSLECVRKQLRERMKIRMAEAQESVPEIIPA
jgi:uncharacterized sulfatase